MEDSIIDNLKTVCLCKNIKKGTVIKSIHSGCRTLEEVNRKVGTGSGDCKGTKCGPKIREIIKSLTAWE